MKRAAALFLILCLSVTFAACGADNSDSQLTEVVDGGQYYFYGVVLKDESYYACVSNRLENEPDREKMLLVPLAAELLAFFQPKGWDGAWSPRQYLTAKDLAAAAENGRIIAGAHFTCGVTDGKMDYLAEINYYEDSNITAEMMTVDDLLADEEP